MVINNTAQVARTVLFLTTSSQPYGSAIWEHSGMYGCLIARGLLSRFLLSVLTYKEAQFQVELARMQYFLLRLLHAHDDLHRQKGGRYGTKDSGEK